MKVTAQIDLDDLHDDLSGESVSDIIKQEILEAIRRAVRDEVESSAALRGIIRQQMIDAVRKGAGNV